MLTQRAGVLEGGGVQGPGVDVRVQGTDEAVGTRVDGSPGGTEVPLGTGPVGGDRSGHSGRGRQTGQRHLFGGSEQGHGQEDDQS